MLRIGPAPQGLPAVAEALARQAPDRTRTVSRPGEFHPRPLSERCVSLSTHTAPIKQTFPPSLAASVQTDAAAS